MVTRRNVLRALVGMAAGAVLPMVGMMTPPLARAATTLHLAPQPGPYDLHVRDYYDKMSRFDAPYQGDIILKGEHLAVMHSTLARLERLVNTVGYGNFALLGVDEALGYARSYSSIGEFTKDELEFMECQFYADAAVYGFYGLKAITRFTTDIRSADVYKVPYSGNYLFCGEALKTWQTIEKALGSEVVLTSGVRGVMKQFHLFLTKAAQNAGNLSLASRSLAPPGYSFHGVSDFDVGQRGFGEFNFTDRFVQTAVFRRLENMGYLTLRYPRGNTLGVRFEPWHVKVKQA